MAAPLEPNLRTCVLIIQKRLLFLLVRPSQEGGSPEVLRHFCHCTRGDGVSADSPGAWGMSWRRSTLEASLTSQFLEPVNLLFSTCQFELSCYADSMLTEDLLCARQPKG